MNRKLGCVGLVVVAGIVVWLFWLSRDAADDDSLPAITPAVGRPSRDWNIAAADGDRGDRACAECHADIAHAYDRSGMGRSWMQIGGRPLGNFEEDNTVSDPKSGYRYRLLVEDGRVIQEETLIEPPGDREHRLRFDARYAVGSGVHAQTMLSQNNGYLYQLPVAWFAEGSRWRLNPGYELFNRRFFRPVLPGCIACHGTYAEHHAPTRNRYKQPIADGISCRRCHGPGERHMVYWAAQLWRKQANGDGADQSDLTDEDRVDRTIVNPAHLSADLANDICLQCHLLGEVTLYQPNKDAFSFRPGERLRDHQLDFFVKTDDVEAFGLASHADRLMRSRCYLETGGELTCIRCHDSHGPIREVPRSFFNARCIECHKPQTCSREVTAGEQKRAEGCVTCHMPQRGTREGQHLVLTDHFIRRKPAEQPPKPTILKPNASVELVGMWPDTDPHGLRLGSAYVRLHETMGPQYPALEQGVKMLTAAHQLGVADADAKDWLGSGLISLRRSDEAVDLLKEVLQEQPNRLRTRFRLGIAYDQMRRYDLAIAEYKTVLQSAADWMEPYPLLARLYLHRRQAKEAVRLLQQQLEYQPDATALAQLALAKSLEGSSPRECLKLIDQALNLDPRHVPGLLNQAYLWSKLGDKKQAAASYRRALEIDPENSTARTALRALEEDGP